MKSSTKPLIICIYHKGCVDGTTAAAVILKKFPDIKLYPLGYDHTENDLAPIYKELASGDPSQTQMIFVDGAFALEGFLSKGVPVTVVDHHVGIKEDLEKLAAIHKNLTYIFDNTKSGASLSWDHFFPDQKEPEVIALVEDYDLWVWKFKDDTKDVNNYLSMYVNKPEVILPLFEESLEVVKGRGRVISEYADTLIGHFIKNPDERLILNVGTFTVPAYNIPIFQSECGNHLSKKLGQVVAMFTIKGQAVKLSVRSEGEQSPSALDIAQILGGGGHKNASGAEIPLEAFLKLIRG